jgi:ribonuclease BN (tRNA processing enzyme)
MQSLVALEAASCAFLRTVRQWARTTGATALVAAMATVALAGPDEVKLTASDASVSDAFGASVAVDGDVAVVGAEGDDEYRGAAYVFARCGGEWTLRAKLTASDGVEYGEFGHSVAVSGDAAVVGAYGDDEAETESGSAYVFTRDAAGNWSERQKLKASDVAANDEYGFSVAISGDTAVVGAYLNDDVGTDSGSAYVFTRDAAGNWSERQKLRALDAAARDQFGISVAISGDIVVVGATGNDDGGSGSGAAYVFTRDAAGKWGERQKLTASDAAGGDEFGRSVAVSGDVAVVGAIANDDAGAESGSAYVFIRNATGTWVQKQKLTAVDAAAGDQFGFSVAVSGDTAVVGAYGDDDGGSASGSAYVFTRDSTGKWIQKQKSKASDAAANDFFGGSVAVSGDTAVVGAVGNGGSFSGSAYVYGLQHKLTAPDDAASDFFGESVAVSGDTAIVGAAGDDDGGTDSGSAYVFTRDAAGTWSEQQKLTASDAAADDIFGVSVAVSGDTAVVGARGDDDDGPDSGSAYVFTRDAAGTWSEQQKLTASDAAAGDGFGCSVALSGDTVVVGANRSDDFTVSLPFDTGSAYVFTRDATGTWIQKQKLTASDAAGHDEFGRPVAVSGDTVFVGANPGTGSESGSAYVFTRDPAGTWIQKQKLKASDAAADESFALSVAVSGDTAIVGAFRNDDGATDSGSAYVFTRDAAGTWIQTQKLGASDAAATDIFGSAVAISGDTAVIGARLDDDGGSASGSAYVFTRDAAGTWSERRKLTASDAAANDQFGFSVAVSGDTAVVAAVLDDDGGSNSGSAYVFSNVGAGTDLEIPTESLPDSLLGAAYHASVRATGGAAPRIFDVAFGALPPPLTLDRNTGGISGRCGVLGTWNFVVRVSDACGHAETRPYTITVSRAEPPPEITTSSLPAAVRDRPFSARLEADHGTPPLGWSVSDGALPDGLAVDAVTGVLSGRPSSAGRSSFRVRVVDATGAADERGLAIDVAPVADLSRKKLTMEVPVNLLSGTSPIVRALELVEGTRLDVAAKFRAQTPAPVALEVVDAAGQSVAAGATVKAAKSNLRLTGIVIPATGRYFVRVVPVAPFEGLVVLTLTATAPAKAGATVSIADGETLDVKMGTLAGARVTVTVKPAKGSAASPVILSVKDDTGAELLVPSELRSAAKGAVLTMKAPVKGGTLTVKLSVAAGTGGDVVWSAKIKQPRGYVHSEPDLAAGSGE